MRTSPAFEAGCNAHIAKPVRKATLLAVIDETLALLAASAAKLAPADPAAPSAADPSTRVTTVTNPPAPIANDRSAADAASPGAGAALPGGASKAAFVRAMFARIVPRYDLVNRLMTMGLDRRWRRETATIVRPS